MTPLIIYYPTDELSARMVPIRGHGTTGYCWSNPFQAEPLREEYSTGIGHGLCFGHGAIQLFDDDYSGVLIQVDQ